MSFFKWLMVKKQKAEDLKPEKVEDLKPAHSEYYLKLRDAYYTMRNDERKWATHKLIRQLIHSKALKLEHWVGGDYYWTKRQMFECWYKIAEPNKYVWIQHRVQDSQIQYTVGFMLHGFHAAKDWWLEGFCLVFGPDSTTGLRLASLIKDAEKESEKIKQEKARRYYKEETDELESLRERVKQNTGR